ncbi:MAG: hypothetical protein NVSMB48_13050 [Marmoricola sp.]
MFAVAKVTATLFGFMAVTVGAPIQAKYFDHGLSGQTRVQQAQYSSHESIRMWFVWDARLYQQAAHDNYLAHADPAVTAAVADHTNPADADKFRFTFAPLYPVTIKVCAFFMGGNYVLAALLISNAAFLGLLVVGYKIGLLLLGDSAAAERSVKYLVLFPTAFLLQSGLSEALLIFLLATTLYLALTRRWWAAAAPAYLAPLAHSTGMFIALPMGILLLQQNQYRLGLRQIAAYLKYAIPIAAPLLGWLTFMAYCRVTTGSWFAYNILQGSGWHTHASDPLVTIWDALHMHAITSMKAWTVIALATIAVLGYRVLKAPLVGHCAVYCLAAFLTPVSNSSEALLRYALPLFPVAFVFASWARREKVDSALTISLGIFQGVLLVWWINYWAGFII